MNRFLILLGIGVGIGILIAPDKGSATRKRITDFIDGVKDEIDKQTGKVVDKVDDTLQELPG